MGQHHGSHRRHLRPEREHLRLEQDVVVEDLVPVDSAVIHFVLEQPQKQMVADLVPARLRLRPGDHENPGLDSGNERRVLRQPPPPLLVPVPHRLVDGVA
ncbi:unnamed protein product [Cuscuta europaea]|uniref:Uncharacterized protein n=1 Tax=Cuscuta europaea TaxID=41803 RepID=A0A9P1E099_CUSEU|nr:unnamed protein product [Cuscuta europaea]